MIEQFAPYIGNTHSESSVTGTTMTKAYHHAHDVLKKHCNASEKDVIITKGSGMTAVINKFQRILGLRIPEHIESYVTLPNEMKPVVFISHMEHHSNQTSWLETFADVIVVDPDDTGLIDLNRYEELLKQHSNRKLIIGAFTACSNVTGIETPYHQLAKLTHQFGGFCFIDFACSAPYVTIDMHPADPEERLDAVLFSPHKFLGGPGTPGVLIFNSELYNNTVPDDPGGGTVDWTNPWGQHKFSTNIEIREDGGTPAFLQTIRAALAVEVKNQMCVDFIHQQEAVLVQTFFAEAQSIPGLHLLAPVHTKRLGAISCYFESIHYNLVVKLLNDRFGIQVRGGCSCAGTYGHYLLHVDPARSRKITEKINTGDLSEKPGWVRISLHPTMKKDEVLFIAQALKDIAKNIYTWEKDYRYDIHTNEYHHISGERFQPDVNSMFHKIYSSHEPVF